MPSLDRHICSIHSTGKAKKWIKGRSRHYWSQFDGIVLRVLRLKISVGICKKRFSAFVSFRSAKIHWWRRHNARKINFAQDGQVQVKISSSGFCLVAPDLVHHPFLLLSVSAWKSMVSICGVILNIAIFFQLRPMVLVGETFVGHSPVPGCPHDLRRHELQPGHLHGPRCHSKSERRRGPRRRFSSTPLQKRGNQRNHRAYEVVRHLPILPASEVLTLLGLQQLYRGEEVVSYLFS